MWATKKMDVPVKGILLTHILEIKHVGTNTSDI